MHSHHSHQLPTLAQLFKATAIAVVIATTLLVTVVLPAEYGIDPTGIGKALSLTSLNRGGEGPSSASAPEAPAAAQTAPQSAPPAQAVSIAKGDLPYRSDDMSLTLQPNEGVEVKATMKKGAQFVFNWTAGGKVNFDMHGEEPNAGEKFTSYWADKQQTAGQGTFIAPFDGTHGWFWRNRGTAPVTVNVKVAGFYEKLAKK